MRIPVKSQEAIKESAEFFIAVVYIQSNRYIRYAWRERLSLSLTILPARLPSASYFCHTHRDHQVFTHLLHHLRVWTHTHTFTYAPPTFHSANTVPEIATLKKKKRRDRQFWIQAARLSTETHQLSVRFVNKWETGKGRIQYLTHNSPKYLEWNLA